MSQSGFILAALLAGFVLFLAARNRLGVYTGVIWGAPAGSSSGGSGSAAGGGIDWFHMAGEAGLDLLSGGLIP